MIEVIPGILEDSFAKIEEKIRLVEPYVEWVQIDIADGALTDKASFRDPQPFKNLETHLNLELHLMVVDPLKVAKDWVGAGFKRLIAHVESNDSREFIDEVKILGAEVGLAIDGPTSIEVIEPFLEETDQVTVMMIKAGKSGQKLQEENLEKIRFIHQNFPELPIEVDGGINDQTAKLVKDAGATRLISTSFLFWQNVDNLKEAIEFLKRV